MNTLSNTGPANATDSNLRPPAFFERMVLQALAAMPAGRLELQWPAGTVRCFGATDGADWQQGVAAPAARAIPARAVIRIIRPEFFRKCVLRGDLGFAEAYMDGDWETPSVAAVIAWFILNLEHAPTLSGSRARALGVGLLRLAERIRQALRANSRTQAVRNIREHYDLSNDFFALWLDPTMMYSAARWERPGFSLEQAQQAKNEALCRKLRLRPDDHVLEIGTGWGGWSLHAVRQHGCRVTTLTLSRQQYELAVRRVAEAGLADRIDVRLQDYRDLPPAERYDKIVSIEMLEAVGHDYLKDWCGVVSRALKPEGLLALQFITCPDSRYEQLRQGVDFIQKHVFPGSLLLSLNRLNQLLAGRGGFVLHELEDMGQDYARTLAEWRIQFQRQTALVEAQGFDERFIRKWNYYLSYCEAAFAFRNISVVQTVHTRPNNLALA